MINDPVVAGSLATATIESDFRQAAARRPLHPDDPRRAWSIRRATGWTARATPSSRSGPAVPQRRRRAGRRLRRPLHRRQPAGDRHLGCRQRVCRHQRQLPVRSAERRLHQPRLSPTCWASPATTSSPATSPPDPGGRGRRLRQAGRLRQGRQAVPLADRHQQRRRRRPRSDRSGRTSSACRWPATSTAIAANGDEVGLFDGTDLVPRHQPRLQGRQPVRLS